MFPKVASYLRFFSVLKLTILGSEASLFVDNFALCIPAKSFLHAHRFMQLCVNSAQDLVSNNGFKFSTSETVCLHFCNQRKHFAEPSTLHKNPIKVVTEAKFLGVIFDRTLSYSSHVNNLKTNCLQVLDILKIVGHTDWGADQKTLLCHYRTLVRSKLDHGCIVHGAASNNILKKLDPIHHQGLRIALGTFLTSPVTSLYGKVQEMSLKNRRNKLSMNNVLKLKTCSDNPAYSRVFEPPNSTKKQTKIQPDSTSWPSNSTTV